MGSWSLSVLTLRGDDRKKWDRLVDALKRVDIFYTSAYLTMSEGFFGNKALLFVFGDAEDYVLYPVVLRRIDELDFYRWQAVVKGSFFDAITPEYGGPAVHVVHPELEYELLRAFLEEFHTYCISNNIVTEFMRLNPFVALRPPVVELARATINRDVVYVDLAKEVNGIWQGFSKGNKSSIRKAQRNGVEILCSREDRHVDAFCNLYARTMARNRALDEYSHPRSFFDDLFRLLGESVVLFAAVHEGGVIAASVFLAKGKVVHYYLSGSDERFWSICPNNLLLYEAILWAKQEGYGILHLGGGHGEPQDSLFKFKASFSTATVGFYVSPIVHNREIYETLCAQRVEYGRLTSNCATRSPGYFPSYRR